MPRGFSGQTVKRFFERTNEAMKKASEAHNRKPFEDTSEGMPSHYQKQYSHTRASAGSMMHGMPMGSSQGTYGMLAKGMYDKPAQQSGPRINMPAFPEPINHKLPYQPEDADPFNDRHKTGVGNRSNIVVEQSVYEECMQKLEAVDDKAGQEIYRMCCTIEEMCKTIYIVPETIPRVMAITSRIKNSMPEFRGITEEVRLQVKKHVDEIGHIDQAPDGFKVIVSDEGAEYVIGSTKDAVGKQVDSMENTAQSYARGAESLRSQADSFRSQAGRLGNRKDMLDDRLKTLEEREAMQAAMGMGNPLGGANPFRMVRD